MPRVTSPPESDNSIFTLIVEQGWMAFIVLGIFLIGLRLYNVKQRNEQRRLLREGLMAELGYKGKIGRKTD